MIVVGSVRKHRQFVLVVFEPVRLSRLVNKSVLYRRRDIAQPYLLLNGRGGVAGNLVKAFPLKLLDQLRTRCLVLDKHIRRCELPGMAENQGS